MTPTEIVVRIRSLINTVTLNNIESLPIENVANLLHEIENILSTPEVRTYLKNPNNKNLLDSLDAAYLKVIDQYSRDLYNRSLHHSSNITNDALKGLAFKSIQPSKSITEMEMYHTQLEQRIKYEIISANSIEQRLLILTRWIRLMQIAQHANDLNTTAIIYTALMSPDLQLMKSIDYTMHQEDRDALESTRNILGSDNGYTYTVTQLRKQKILIPFFPVIKDKLKKLNAEQLNEPDVLAILKNHAVLNAKKTYKPSAAKESTNVNISAVEIKKNEVIALQKLRQRLLSELTSLMQALEKSKQPLPSAFHKVAIETNATDLRILRGALKEKKLAIKKNQTVLQRVFITLTRKKPKEIRQLKEIKSILKTMEGLARDENKLTGKKQPSIFNSADSVFLKKNKSEVEHEITNLFSRLHKIKNRMKESDPKRTPLESIYSTYSNTDLNNNKKVKELIDCVDYLSRDEHGKIDVLAQEILENLQQIYTMNEIMLTPQSREQKIANLEIEVQSLLNVDNAKAIEKINQAIALIQEIPENKKTIDDLRRMGEYYMFKFSVLANSDDYYLGLKYLKQSLEKFAEEHSTLLSPEEKNLHQKLLAAYEALLNKVNTREQLANLQYGLLTVTHQLKGDVRVGLDYHTQALAAAIPYILEFNANTAKAQYSMPALKS